MKRILLAVALAIASSSCNNPEALTFEDGLGFRNIEPLTPTDARSLWQEVESCSGLTGDFDAVHWYLDPDGVFFHGVPAAGIWLKEQNTIIMSPPYEADPRMIKHEIMHALLRGGFDHPHQYFLDGPCGHLMNP